MGEIYDRSYFRAIGAKISTRAVGNLMPEWLIASAQLKELDDYVKSLYDLAYSSGYKEKAEGDLTMLEGLAAKGLKFKVSSGQTVLSMLLANLSTSNSNLR